MPEFRARDIPKESAEWTAIMMRQMVAQQGANLVAVIQAKVKALEESLQEGESLVVYCDAGKERIRVEAFEFPSWHLAIVSGTDEESNKSYRIENVQDIKLTCKALKGVPKKRSHRLHPTQRTKRESGRCSGRSMKYVCS